NDRAVLPPRPGPDPERALRSVRLAPRMDGTFLADRLHFDRLPPLRSGHRARAQVRERPEVPGAGEGRPGPAQAEDEGRETEGRPGGAGPRPRALGRAPSPA